ncbi:hypothetical protein J6X09_02065 [Candidatus Saccharibacteria bacterium]|nr:hypothetical protein [Candidatus Saccharibacteria bacterium]
MSIARILYFNGTEFTENRASEAAFEFEIDGGTMKVKAPNVSPDTTAASVYDEQVKLAVLGAGQFFDERHALTRKNDGSALRCKETENGKFLAEAPEACQIVKRDCEHGKKVFIAWVDDQSKKLGFKKDEGEKKEEPKKEETKQEETKKAEPKQEETKKAEPAKVTKLDDDIGKWHGDVLDKYFDGEADFDEKC